MKRLYKFFLENLPRPLLIRLSYLFKLIAPLLYKGKKVHCPCCERSFSKFLSYGVASFHRDKNIQLSISGGSQKQKYDKFLKNISHARIPVDMSLKF